MEFSKDDLIVIAVKRTIRQLRINRKNISNATMKMLELILKNLKGRR